MSDQRDRRLRQSIGELEESEVLAERQAELDAAVARAENAEAEVERLRAERSATARLEAWAKKHEWRCEVFVRYVSGWTVEMSLTTNAGFRRLVIYDRPHPRPPMVNERYHEIYLGTDDAPATLDQMIGAALKLWEELHGEQ